MMEKNLIYQEILKHVKEGVYFVDTDRKITFWNNHAEKITGFTAAEVLEKHCFDNILNHVDDEGTHLCWQGCPLHRTMEDSFNREASVYLHHKQGHRVPVMVRTYPLYDEDQLIGAIELFSDEKPPIQLMKEIEDLKVLAMTDQLTGLANRRYTESFLSGKIVELDEFKTPFGVALVDIDHFKAVNDTYGHDVGDLAIQMTVRSLVGAVRSSDLVGRWGGEEFLVVFSVVDFEQLQLITERMRMLVETSSVQRQGSDIRVTVSIGAVFVEKPSAKDCLIQMADQLMYQSKREGRNRISLATLG
jgi:diguanylate cyclase (GGDEF)-like protein/PAS domain S-box-containing protein